MRRLHRGYFRELAIDTLRAIAMLAVVTGLVTWPFFVAGFLQVSI